MGPFFPDQEFVDYYVSQEGRKYTRQAGPFDLDVARNILDDWRHESQLDNIPADEFPKIVKTVTKITNSVVEGV